MMKGKKLERILMFVLATPFLLCAAYVVIIQVGTWYAYATWRNKTSPLPEETKTYLCMALGITDIEAKCSPEQSAYAPDFFPYIPSHILDNELDRAEVDDIFGRFNPYCGNPAVYKEDKEVINCWFDLRGDREFEFVVAYSLSGEVVYVSAELVVGE